MNKTNKIILGALILGLAGILILIGGLKGRTSSAKEVLPNLTTDILKVGRADSIILETEGKVMVIDTGEEDDGQELLDTLAEKQVEEIEVLVITHYDKDHVGGADILLENVPVKKIILPDYVGVSTDYADFMAVLEKLGQEKEMEVIKLTENTEFELGTAHIKIEPPSSYEIPEGVAEYDNDLSLITTVTHGANKLLFMGDAEKTLIRDWLSKGSASDCDFLKLPHHGVYTSALTELMDAVTPESCVITNSDKNPADTKTLELLKMYGIKTFETRYGDVRITSDGARVRAEQ